MKTEVIPFNPYPFLESVERLQAAWNDARDAGMPDHVSDAIAKAISDICTAFSRPCAMVIGGCP